MQKIEYSEKYKQYVLKKSNAGKKRPELCAI